MNTSKSSGDLPGQRRVSFAVDTVLMGIIHPSTITLHFDTDGESVAADYNGLMSIIHLFKLLISDLLVINQEI